jgi:FHS family Na+ dependent glucose MFS transporter 1
MQKTQDIAKPGNLTKAAGYYAAFIALGLTSASLGPTLPGLAANINASLGQASYLFAARWLGYLIGSLRGGRWFDRFPGHRLQALVLLVMAVMMAIVPTVPVLWLLAAVLAVLGFSEATVDAGGNILLVWVYQDKVAPYMNALHFFFGLGAFISPIIVAQVLAQTGNSTAAYWVLALLILPAVVLLGRLPSPPIRAALQEDQGRGRISGLVALIMLFFFLAVGAEASFGGWIYSYALAQNLGTNVTAAYLTSVFWGALTVGRLLAIPIATRVHPRWILLGDLLGCLASLGVLLVGQGSYSAAWAGTLGTGLFMASVFPTTLTLAERYLHLTGAMTGWFLVGGAAGAVFFPWLIGQLFEPVGPTAAIAVILAAVAAALLVLIALLLRIRRST